MKLKISMIEKKKKHFLHNFEHHVESLIPLDCKNLCNMPIKSGIEYEEKEDFKEQATSISHCQTHSRFHGTEAIYGWMQKGK